MKRTFLDSEFVDDKIRPNKHYGGGLQQRMPPLPSPSATASRGRGNRRRSAKLVQRQCSQSSVKNANGPQYRAMNMADANVFVDHFPEAPIEIEEQLVLVFDRPTCIESQQGVIEALTTHYCEESRVLAKKCAGENEWRSNLFHGLLQPLSRLEGENLMLSASERPWLSVLKPTAPSLYDFVSPPIAPLLRPDEGQQSGHSHTDLVIPRTASFLLSIRSFNAPSSTPSDASSENPNSLSTSEPDITLGLAHTSFTSLQKSVLMLLQDDCRVLSEPHQVQIGLRFPFLIVESKAGAADGNMIGAQNHAAVDGACALNILGDLQGAVTEIMPRSKYARQPQSNENKERREGNELLPVVFSVITEGPLHEIWVHYRQAEAYHMTCLRTWRTTQSKDAREFVNALARIVDWGKTDFRESVLTLLERIGGPVLQGILGKMDEDSVISDKRG
ncbi:hypothetical protein B7463_g4790, partial [Scytalidium lignicola]